jgi:hypothetical protein
LVYWSSSGFYGEQLEGFLFFMSLWATGSTVKKPALLNQWDAVVRGGIVV